MQHRYTEEQIPHLANGVYQALRKGWRVQTSDLSPSPFHSFTSTIPRPEHSGNIIINSKAAMHILPPHEHTGPSDHLAILIDADMHDKLLIELSQQHEDEWHQAITHPGSIYTLWRYRTDREQWRPNTGLPTSVPETGIKLARRLLDAKLIWPVTTDQLRAFIAHDDKPTPPESITTTIENAVERALG